MNKSNLYKIYVFERFRLDAGHLMLYGDAEEIPLPPKAVETLLVLIERRGEILSKDELMSTIWADSMVEESNLAKYLHILRNTLGDQQNGKPFIETFRRRGYRFNGEVHLVEEAVEDKNHQLTVDEFEQSRANIQSQAVRLHVVKNWNRNTTEFEKISSTSSAVPALIPFESSHDLTPPKNELPPDELSTDLEVSEGTLKQATRLVSDTGESRHSKLRYVLAGSLVILLAGGSAATFYWRSRHLAASNVDKPLTLAILPLRPIGDENRDEILEFGMADTLITRLGSNRMLEVRPSSSVSNFGGPNRDAIKAGQALNVEAVLDPTIQRSGDHIRVNLSLKRVADGTTIWSDTIDEDFTDIFAVQDKITAKIVSGLALNLNTDERARVQKRYTSNPEAQDFYIRGRVNKLKITKEGLWKAVGFFEQAIKADPNYALAYAHEADAYRILGTVFENPKETWPKVLELAKKALEIDGSLGEARLQLAQFKHAYGDDLISTEAEFKQVIDMNPADFQSHLGYAMFLSGNTKRFEEAVVEARRASELSLGTPIAFALESQILLRAELVEEAVTQAKKALDLDQNFWVAHLHLGNAYSRQKRYDDAIAELEKAGQLAPEASGPPYALARALILKGDHEKAYAIVREMESQRSERFVRLTSLAAIYSGLGHKDKALDLLERALAEREQSLRIINIIPFFNNLRSEPRFQNILKRMNLEK